jgi:hypothetical protein
VEEGVKPIRRLPHRVAHSRPPDPPMKELGFRLPRD